MSKGHWISTGRSTLVKDHENCINGSKIWKITEGGGKNASSFPYFGKVFGNGKIHKPVIILTRFAVAFDKKEFRSKRIPGGSFLF